MVRLAFISTVAAALFTVAAAEFSITVPNSNTWWVAKSQNVVAWSCHDSPPHESFTVLLANKDQKVLTAPIAIIGVQNNFDCSKLLTPNDVGQSAATGYTILFANILNQTDVFARSEEFEIKAFGSAYPTTTSTAGSTSTSSGSAAPTGSGNATNTGGNNAAAALGFSLSSLLGSVVFVAGMGAGLLL
ncbi:hypothetical protein Hypma_003857 [Hypsizygus marmoreus]|uniref:Uncharacterized protein n=1 Tax=Hypsizygus marmoreus TaxID=39966 RepID=A0A369K6V5_HYPMA|nr:hypothetical protein Hypma_003857 [Hypsizygus marmoreus]